MASMAVSEISPLSKIKEPVNAKELEDASRQFEAVFLKQFIGEALKPLLHETPGSQVAGAGVYQHMITDVIAENLSNSGEFGFSSMLQAQLADQVGLTEPSQKLDSEGE